MWPKTSSIDAGVLLHWVLFVVVGFPLLLRNTISTASPLNHSKRLAVPDPEPKGPLSFHALSKRVVPTTDQIAQAIDENGQVGRKPSVFWTAMYDYPGPSAYLTAVRWATAKFGGRCNFNMYTDLLAADDYRRLVSQANGPQEDDLAIKHFSKAFARRSVGTVYLVTPDGRQPADGSVWKVWEA